MKLSRLSEILSAVYVLLGLQIAAADANTPTQLGYIEFFNKGAYTIDNVWIKWKVGGETKQHRFTQNLSGGAGLSSACYDLSLVKSSDGAGIPDGAEVWLTASIQTGETKSCRKDTKHYYKAGSTDVWKLRIGGESYTNNRCKNGISDDRVDSQHGNSKFCS
ncbi:MAG: hypothetical protein AAFP81_08025 [Pseudomonadota bacterium]